MFLNKNKCMLKLLKHVRSSVLLYLLIFISLPIFILLSLIFNVRSAQGFVDPVANIIQQPNLPYGSANHTSVIYNNTLFIFGGGTSGNTDAVLTSNINPDGSLGGWSNSNYILPDRLIWHSTVINDNNVYLIGGAEVVQSTIVKSVDTVFLGKIDTDNNIKTWTPLNSLPQKLHFGRAIIVNNRIYYIGGEYRNGEGEGNAVYTNTVYSAAINPDGTIGNWRSETSLPETRTAFALFETSGNINGSVVNRLIMVGGDILPTNTHTNKVLYSDVLSDGSLTDWNALDPFPVGIDNPGYTVSNNKLFIIGGGIPSSALDTIYFSEINSDGLPGNWQLSNVHLPQHLRRYPHLLPDRF